MKKIIGPVFLILIIAGCGWFAHGLIGELPQIDNPDEAAEIVIVRTKSFDGKAISFNIVWDGENLVAIRNGEYTKFKVGEGKHVIGVRQPGQHLGEEAKPEIVNIYCDPGEQYFFIVRPSLGTPSIERVPEEEAQAKISESKFLDLEQAE
jgi:hypothetical protein